MKEILSEKHDPPAKYYSYEARVVFCCGRFLLRFLALVLSSGSGPTANMTRDASRQELTWARRTGDQAGARQGIDRRKQNATQQYAHNSSSNRQYVVFNGLQVLRAVAARFPFKAKQTEQPPNGTRTDLLHARQHGNCHARMCEATLFNCAPLIVVLLDGRMARRHEERAPGITEQDRNTGMSPSLFTGNKSNTLRGHTRKPRWSCCRSARQRTPRLHRAVRWLSWRVDDYERISKQATAEKRVKK